MLWGCSFYQELLQALLFVARVRRVSTLSLLCSNPVLKLKYQGRTSVFRFLEQIQICPCPRWKIHHLSSDVNCKQPVVEWCSKGTDFRSSCAVGIC